MKVQTDYVKPAHGSTITFKDNGNKALFLDNGTFKGMYLTPGSAACILTNLGLVQGFATANPPKAKEPKAARKVEAKPATDPEIAAQLASINAKIAELKALRDTQTGRLDPAAAATPAAA
jgi:hypothetical protein